MSDSGSKRIAAGVCGVPHQLPASMHKFVLGYTKEGVIMLLISLLTCGIAIPATGLIGLIEGIIYLVKSDAEFEETYVKNKKGWF